MTDEHTHFEAVTYPEAEREAMTLTDKLAALPPYLRTTAELSQATGYTSLGMLREWQNKAVLARNALLCEALNRTIRKIEGYQRAGWIMGGGALEEVCLFCVFYWIK